VHLVDCFDLPVDDDFDMSVDNDSFSQESLSSEDIVTGERSDDVNKLALDPSTGLFFENQEYDEENPLLVLENVHGLTLMPEGEDPILYVTGIEDVDEVFDDEEEEEDFTKKHTYFDLDQNLMKIVSFPDLKEKLEFHLCCCICAAKKRIGNLIVEQNTYKIATVLSFSCKYGHDFTVAPECIDNKKIDSSENFKINFCFILVMQILSKGLRTMSTFLGLLGILVSAGNYKVWKKFKTKLVSLSRELHSNAVPKTYKKRWMLPLPQAFCL